jgi:hypothetical protein
VVMVSPFSAGNKDSGRADIRAGPYRREWPRPAAAFSLHSLPRRQPPRGIAPVRIFLRGLGAGLVVTRKRQPRCCRPAGSNAAAWLKSRLSSSRGIQQLSRRAVVRTEAAAESSDCDALRRGSFGRAGQTRSKSKMCFRGRGPSWDS